MKQFQQAHLVLTAVSIPVAILVCWLVYRRSSSKQEEESDVKVSHQKHASKNENKLDENSKRENATASSNNLDIDKSKTTFITNDHDNLTITESSETVCSNKELKQSSGNGSIPLLPAAIVSSNNVIEEHVQEEQNLTNDTCVVFTEKPKNQIVVIDSSCLSNSFDSPPILVEDDTNEIILLHKVSESEKTEQIDSSVFDAKSFTSCESESKSFTSSSQHISEDENKTVDDLAVDLEENVTCLKAATQNTAVNGDSEAVIPTKTLKDDSGSKTNLTDPNKPSELKSIENEINNGVNANNNNSSSDITLTNGQDRTQLKNSLCSESNDQYCDSCGLNKSKTPLSSDNEQNGWDESNSIKTDGEEVHPEDKEDKSWSRKRPNSLHKLDSRKNGESTIQVHVEFPSEKVGLLIGKQGRNIKQLKQDSGADVFVHTAKNRDDIQVLQIQGTQSEIESCVSRIKRRFNDVTLSSFDPANICTSPPSSSGVSPNPNSPPPVLFSMPNISQLRLPEGHTVDVLVSAIAAVDCLFLQQYTHPSYQALENLERAMAHCYAEPTTPSLPKPVQAGLICAAPQQGMWYRAQVIQCYEETEEILIKFMDYGGYATVSDNSIKQIRADFVTLPFQAVECYLDNIAPPEDNRYCEETVAKIAEILKEGRYQVRVTGYRSDGHPKVHLYKCHNSEVALFNQTIVTKGLATWVEPAPFH